MENYGVLINWKKKEGKIKMAETKDCFGVGVET